MIQEEREKGNVRDFRLNCRRLEQVIIFGTPSRSVERRAYLRLREGMLSVSGF